MKEIYLPRFKEIFSFNKKHTDLAGFYFFNQKIFNKLTVAILFIIINFLLGFTFHYCLVISISSAAYLLYLYIKIKKICQCISISRSAPSIAREFDLINVEYKLYNSASFDIDNIQISDTFDGNSEQILDLVFPKSILKEKFFISKKNIKLDSGMGIKKFGPINIFISDPLDIFCFQIKETKINEIKVYPKIEKIKEMIMRGNEYATTFGLYDTQSRGDTANFIGVKPYAPGDQVKRINWKLTLKTKKTVINEFEKNVNSICSIILNLDEKLHMGNSELSTWEFSKDISLAIASQQIEIGNDIQFFSNGIYLPSNSGQEHINLIELLICTLPLSKINENSRIVEKSISQISFESKLIYISPILSCKNFDDNLTQIKIFSKFNQHIHVIFIDGTEFITKVVKGSSHLALEGIYHQTQNLIKSTLKELEQHGVRCSVVKITKDLPYSKQVRDSLNPTIGAYIE